MPTTGRCRFTGNHRATRDCLGPLTLEPWRSTRWCSQADVRRASAANRRHGSSSEARRSWSAQCVQHPRVDRSSWWVTTCPARCSREKPRRSGVLQQASRQGCGRSAGPPISFPTLISISFSFSRAMCRARWTRWSSCWPGARESDPPGVTVLSPSTRADARSRSSRSTPARRCARRLGDPTSTGYLFELCLPAS